MDEWNGEDRRECGGCSSIDQMHSDRATDKVIEDERWDLIKKYGKIFGVGLVIGFSFISIIATLFGGGTLWIMNQGNEQLKLANTKIDKLTDKISENTSVSAVTQQALFDHEKQSTVTHDRLTEAIEYDKISLQMNGNHDNEVRHKLGMKPANTSPFEGAPK